MKNGKMCMNQNLQLEINRLNRTTKMAGIYVNGIMTKT